MNSRRSSSLLAGKALRRLSRLRGGGSALPGLVVEKLDPQFLKNALQHLPHGVVVISGTNGKTTTTKLVVALLESQDLRVFTNPTGSNFKRGILSAIIEKSKFRGKLDYDIAVLELDEAHGALFVRDVKPRFSLLLNVMRDQLDRFGEIDSTTRMLETIAMSTTQGIVLNAEDARISSIASKISDKTVRFFGLSDRTRSHFPDDDGLYAQADTPPILSVRPREIDVTLEDFMDQSATFTVGDELVTANLKLTGAYNLFNAAAAIALVRLIIGQNLNKTRLIEALSSVEPAFGRGERLLVDNVPIDLLLVKNPSGFRLSLGSFPAGSDDTMIAINDNYADGRDMSWLWDVDFSSLKPSGAVMLSGTRAYDMALRLQYDEVEVSAVEPNLQKALKQFLHSNDQPKRIFCTYTAMLAIRKHLTKYTAVERAL